MVALDQPILDEDVYKRHMTKFMKVFQVLNPSSRVKPTESRVLMHDVSQSAIESEASIYLNKHHIEKWERPRHRAISVERLSPISDALTSKPSTKIGPAKLKDNAAELAAQKAEMNTPKRRGRPPGSKNKPKVAPSTEPKRRGRPLGSKNKPKTDTSTPNRSGKAKRIVETDEDDEDYKPTRATTKRKALEQALATVNKHMNEDETDSEEERIPRKVSKKRKIEDTKSTTAVKRAKKIVFTKAVLKDFVNHLSKCAIDFIDQHQVLESDDESDYCEIVESKK